MNKMKKFFNWIWANKCTIGGIATGAVTVISGVGVIDVNSFPELMIGSFNLTPFLYYAILGGLTIVCSFFPETIEKFKARIEKAKAEKEARAIEKEALKEIKEEKKVANQTQAEAEKTVAKQQAKELAKEAKDKAEAEHRAKVEEAKARILAQTNNNQNA